MRINMLDVCYLMLSLGPCQYPATMQEVLHRGLRFAKIRYGDYMGPFEIFFQEQRIPASHPMFLRHGDEAATKRLRQSRNNGPSCVEKCFVQLNSKLNPIVVSGKRSLQPSASTTKVTQCKLSTALRKLPYGALAHDG